MFSAGYYNNKVVISTNNIRRINFENVENLHQLAVKSLNSQNAGIIFDFKGVKFIDSASFAAIDYLHKLATRTGSNLSFTNVDQEVLELFDLIPETADYTIEEFAVPAELELAEVE